jgi:phage pi2 protein 07
MQKLSVQLSIPIPEDSVIIKKTELKELKNL